MDRKKEKNRQRQQKYRLKQLSQCPEVFKQKNAAKNARYREKKELERIEANKKKPKKNFIGTEVCVKKFYELELISRQLPGKKDYVTVKIDGVSHQIQKYVMLMTLTEAHQEFRKMFPDRPISLSKFTKLRPIHVVLVKDTPLNSCCCIYCENMKLLFAALKLFLPQQIQSLSSLLANLVCDTNNFLCMRGKCPSCSHLSQNLEQMFGNDNDSCLLKLSRWEKVDGFMQKMHLYGKFLNSTGSKI